MVHLPSFILASQVLTDEDKLKLSSVHHIPSDTEVDEIRFLPDIQELLNAFIGDDSTRFVHLQMKAKEYIDSGDFILAWKVLLL